MKLPDLAGWAQAGIAGLVAAGGSIYWAGNANVAIHDNRHDIEVVAKAQQADHDKIIGLQADVNNIKGDVSDIKADTKTIIANQNSRKH